MTTNWTTTHIPNLNGKVAVITGANSGIGFETAKVLAAKEATVVMACRNLEKANQAAQEIRLGNKRARLEIMQLDLANLASVRKFVETFKAKYTQLHLLINNAGVMIPPYTQTADHFELQFGANHLGHFALTGLLFDIILATPQARIVNISSMAHRMGAGTIDFDNLNAEKGYNPRNAYAQSKLANLLFTLELNKRLAKLGSDVIATAAHPGWTVTGLQKGFLHKASEWIGQQPEMGALPTLRAALDPKAQRNDYFGPSGFMEMRGYPQKVETSAAAKDSDLAQRLWHVSEKMTGVSYAWPVLA
ncbi:MAG: SDR family NAD(P)-dependent oxidoreductase [Ardenticatenaceae bacterium]|nr:SDR family NAD(P)-dependent oxidoreductase [Ardenticatenaceae bacterium]